MKTSLYIPFTDFKINNLDGQKILYENLVQSGPAYELIVHESPAWLKIKDEMPRPEMIEIISNRKAEQYKEIVNRFFSPITEAVPSIIVNGQKQPTENLVTDLRRALSYILIAHDYKARIYEDDILKYEFKLSEWLKLQKNVFSEEAIKRAEFVEGLLSGYKRNSIYALSVNKDERIFKDLMDLLKKEEVKMLSEKNHLLGIIGAKKDILEREIKQMTTQIVKNEWFPYLVSGALVTLSYYVSLGDMEKVLTFLSGLGAKVLSKFDFREYSPPIQNPILFEFVNPEGLASFSYNPFNYEYKFFVPRR